MILGNDKVCLPEPAMSYFATDNVSKPIELLLDYRWQGYRADAAAITEGLRSPNILLGQANDRAQSVIANRIAEEGNPDADSVQSALPVVLWLIGGIGIARERFNGNAYATRSIYPFSEPSIIS